MDEDEKLLCRRVADAVKAAGRTGVSKYLGFMNERQRELAESQLARMQWSQYSYEGGFEGAERMMLCVFEDKEDVSPPICPVHIRPGLAGRELDHRDYLGSILGTGIRRECVGDILVQEDGATVFMLDSMAAFLCDELTQVGRMPVKVEPASLTQPPERADGQKEEHTASVASLRLDAVLAAMLHTGRAAAAELVKQDRVQVNHLAVGSTHYTVQQGDVFSVRGHGKFELLDTGGRSRKQRILIRYWKY